MTGWVRVFGEPVLHRFWAHDPEDDRIGWTACRVRFCWMEWPRGYPRPPLPRCSSCAR